MEDNHIFHMTGSGADQDPKGVFTINRLTGEVSVSQELDREAINSYMVSTLPRVCAQQKETPTF